MTLLVVSVWLRRGGRPPESQDLPSGATWSSHEFKPRHGKQFEIFFQPELINAFNETTAQFVDATILDATNSGLAAFNPFTETPVEGVHFGKGPNFGQPTSAEDFQTPRTFRFSVGFRF